eukprot:305116_1
MMQAMRPPLSPKSPSKPNKSLQSTSLSSLNASSSESNEAHNKDILDSAEKWITQRLLFHEYVTAFDLLEKFDVNPKLARMLITRFEKRTSTYAIYPLSMDSATPRSSLEPLEQMLASNHTHIATDRSYKISHAGDISIGSIESYDSNHIQSRGRMKNINAQSTHSTATQKEHKSGLFLEPVLSDHGLFISPSVSPRIYNNPYDYIDYKKSSFETWFSQEKHLYIIAIQECFAAHKLGLPEFIAEMIVVNTVVLPGCYTLTGLLLPAARNEGDLFAEYANKENGYMTDKTEKGIAYKRKKPMVNVRRPENNTASLWLDEDGSICGFRCIWVQGIRKMMVDQKFCVLNGCWTLSGEITITFEQWDVEDEFEGKFSWSDSVNSIGLAGRWMAGREFYGEFSWFVTTIESFYLKHNIPIESTDYIALDDHGSATVISSRLGFHDSMG